jgi:hypothetical protein
MRILVVAAAAILMSSSANAGNSSYGPKSGVFGTGYKDKVEDDGSLRIVTEYHSPNPDFALNVALYRAAEIARSVGKPFVQILGGHASARNGVALGYVFARPTDSAAAPLACRRAKTCYTANVGEVLAALSGPRGNEPGVVRPTGTDRFGRSVSFGGYGAGAVAWTER